MINHEVRTYKSSENLPREEQLAYKIAQVAADPVEVDADVTDMVINRVIDNAAVAAASVFRSAPKHAREQSSPTSWSQAPPYSVFPTTPTSHLNGRHGQTVSPFVNSTSTTPSWQRNTPTQVTTSQRFWLLHSTRESAVRTWSTVLLPDTKSRSTWSRASACTSTRSTTSLTWAHPQPPESVRFSTSQPTSSTRP